MCNIYNAEFMLKEERQQYILNRLNESYKINITSLSNELNVSDDTLRRDLTEMDCQGLLTKVHGGAIAKSGIPMEFTGRLKQDIRQKQNLAAKVVPLFKKGEVILIDGGTSNLEVIRQLPKDMELTIYTNSFPIVSELIGHPKIEVVFLGGSLFRSSQVTVGVSVFQALQTIYADWLVLGVCSVHPKLGLSGPDREESTIKRLMLGRANKKIIIADNHKLNKAENYIIGSLGDIDYLILEDDKIDEAKKNFSRYRCNIL